MCIFSHSIPEIQAEVKDVAIVLQTEEAEGVDMVGVVDVEFQSVLSQKVLSQVRKLEAGTCDEDI